MAGKHIATAIVTDAAPDDGPRWYPGRCRRKDVSRHRPVRAVMNHCEELLSEVKTGDLESL